MSPAGGDVAIPFPADAPSTRQVTATLEQFSKAVQMVAANVRQFVDSTSRSLRAFTAVHHRMMHRRQGDRRYARCARCFPRANPIPLPYGAMYHQRRKARRRSRR